MARPDPTFGTNGVALAGPGDATALEIDRHGRYVVAGVREVDGADHVLLTRLTSDGPVDRSFADQGEFVFDPGPGADMINDIAIDNQDRVVIAGAVESGASQIMLAGRLTEGGQPDDTFGGISTYDVGSAAWSGASAIQLDAAGRLVVGGVTSSSTDLDLLAVRLDDTGALDPTFADGGYAQVSSGPAFDIGAAILIQPDGGIVVGGLSTPHPGPNNGSYDPPILIRLTGDTPPLPPITNAAPVVERIAPQTNWLGSTVEVSVVASDDDGDPLTYAASGLPAGIAIDPSGGTMGGTAEQLGVFDVIVTASDGITDASIEFRWTITEPAVFENGSFEQPVAANVWNRLATSDVEGWQSRSNHVDLWRSGWAGSPAEGQQFAELNTFEADTLHQDFATSPGQVLYWAFDHRGRSDDDTVRMTIGSAGQESDPDTQEFTSPPWGWRTYSGSYVVPVGQTVTRLQFEAVDQGSAGNFIDNVRLADQPISTEPEATAFSNGSFETPVTESTWTRLGATETPGWSSKTGSVDVWRSGWAGAASDGEQFVELNTMETDHLLQRFTTTPGETLYWSFDHRGRLDEDTVEVSIGSSTRMTVQTTMTTGPGPWRTYSGTYEVPAGQTITIFRLGAVDAGSVGNFVDNVQISTEPPPPVPFVNGSFEEPVTSATWTRLSDDDIGGWSTLSDSFDVWRSGWNGPAAEGDQFAELNTFESDGVFQDFTTTPGETLTWSLKHRGRADEDTFRVILHDPEGTTASSQEFSTGPGAWVTYEGTYTVPAGQTTTRILLQAVDPGPAGNFVDDVIIVGVP